MKSLAVELDDDTYNYLEFLERMMFIRSKVEAVQQALLLFKKLSMHDWLPDIYRIGDSRIILMDRGMLLDTFEVLKPEFRDIDLTKPANWMIVLKELENFGWGKFSKVENEIKVENCAVPSQYLRGYLESMFKVELEEHRTQVESLIIFLARKRRLDEWR